MNRKKSKRNVKRSMSSLLVLLLFALLISCSNMKKNTSSSPEQSVKITGDVVSEFSFNTLSAFDVVSFPLGSDNKEGVRLSDLLSQVTITGSDNCIYLDAYDGVLASFPLENVNEKSYIYYDNGWRFYDENFPKQTRVRNIKQIVIRSQTIETMTPCLRIIYGDQVISKSYGDLFTEKAETTLVTEGKPLYKGNEATALTRRSLIPLRRYFDNLSLPADVSLIGYGKDGSETALDADGYLEYRGNSVDYIGTDLIERKPQLIGIFVDPPPSIHDIYGHIIGRLKENQKVLAIELDGVGYYDFVEIKPPYLSQFPLNRYRTVFPSISNVALASYMTGLTPKEDGITAKVTRNVQVPDIFDELSTIDKTGIVVEGDTQLISLSIDQILSPDRDHAHGTDNEVFAHAQAALKANKDYTFIHFHGYDDVAHEYGPFSDEAYAKLYEIDGYVKELLKDFHGTFIIFADHGQHDVTYNGKLGNHGEFLPIDMTIPYIEEKI